MEDLCFGDDSSRGPKPGGTAADPFGDARAVPTPELIRTGGGEGIRELEERDESLADREGMPNPGGRERGDDDERGGGSSKPGGPSLGRLVELEPDLSSGTSRFDEERAGTGMPG